METALDDLQQKVKKFNNFASVKSVGQNFLNVSVILLLISFLFTTWSLPNSDSTTGFRALATTVVCLELALRIVLTIIVLYVNNTKFGNETGDKCSCSLVQLNKTVTIMSGILSIVSAVTAYAINNDIKSIFDVLNANTTNIISGNGTM